MDYLSTILELAGISRAELAAAKLSPALASRLALKLANGALGALGVSLADIEVAHRDPEAAQRLWGKLIDAGEGGLQEEKRLDELSPLPLEGGRRPSVGGSRRQTLSGRCEHRPPREPCRVL